MLVGALGMLRARQKWGEGEKGGMGKNLIFIR